MSGRPGVSTADLRPTPGPTLQFAPSIERRGTPISDNEFKLDVMASLDQIRDMLYSGFKFQTGGPLLAKEFTMPKTPGETPVTEGRVIIDPRPPTIEGPYQNAGGRKKTRRNKRVSRKKNTKRY